MKYLKHFEMNENEPQIGDYVIVNYNINQNSPAYVNYINTHIGKLYNKRRSEKFGNKLVCDIDYIDIVNTSYIEDIEFWSKDKGELEAIIQSKKFNI